MGKIKELFGKFQKLFNFDNVGKKIKSVTKWACWVTILLIWVAAVVYFGYLLGNKWLAKWCLLVPFGAAALSVIVWSSSWGMYAFGDFVDDIHALRRKNDREEEKSK